jgi:hypothetical protein
MNVGMSKYMIDHRTVIVLKRNSAVVMVNCLFYIFKF